MRLFFFASCFFFFLPCACRFPSRVTILHHFQHFHGSSIHQWRTARSIRKPFVPRSVNLFNIHGKLTSKGLRATTFAEYLSENYGRLPIPDNPSPVVECSAPFTMSEPNIARRSLSTGRAPGPDTIPAGMIKGSPYVLKLFLFDDSKHCLSTSTVPDSWALSEVVMLVKKSSRIHVISLTIA